ncbi:MAG: hypothetical protein Q4C58_15300 [Eubacteriales bacterium]|nr:hypothetical protein [Eubacteriales bacterium]
MKGFRKKGAVAVIGMIAVFAVAAAVGLSGKSKAQAARKEENFVQESAVERQEGGDYAESEKDTDSTKNAVLELEDDIYDTKVPAGDRTKMIRLTIGTDSAPVFEIRKEASENQVDFEEWYVTEPYSYKQLVNVSDLYSFLDHYATWSCIGQAEDIDFEDSGLYVEEEFSDTGIVKFMVGQKNEAGNYYVKADYSGNIYEMDGTQVETMTRLQAEDFMMRIASLVYLTTVEKLEIRTDETQAVFDIETDSENNQTYEKDGEIMDEEVFKEMYSSLLSIVIAEETDENPTRKNPVLQLNFIRNTDKLKNTEVNYYPYDENYYVIEKDGQAQFLAEKGKVDEVIGLINSFCR